MAGSMIGCQVPYGWASNAGLGTEVGRLGDLSSCS